MLFLFAVRVFASLHVKCASLQHFATSYFDLHQRASFFAFDFLCDANATRPLGLTNGGWLHLVLVHHHHPNHHHHYHHQKLDLLNPENLEIIIITSSDFLCDADARRHEGFKQGQLECLASCSSGIAIAIIIIIIIIIVRMKSNLFSIRLLWHGQVKTKTGEY